MKKILIFIGLKLAEIAGICGIVGILNRLGIVMVHLLNILPPLNHENFSNLQVFGLHCLAGAIGLSLLAIIGLICFGIYHAIKANWAWADKLSKK